MSTIIIALGCAILILFSGWCIGLLTEKAAKTESRPGGLSARELINKEGMPEIFRSATLVLSEQTLWITKPVKKAGTPDQLWELPGGDLVLSDTKTRKHISDDDIMQMSIYRLLVEANGYGEVADLAYVRLAPRNRPVRWVPVTLLHRNKAEQALIRRAMQGESISAKTSAFACK